jgi:hypothetical protein
MRLSDLDKLTQRQAEIKANEKLGTREVDLTGEKIVEAMKLETSMAKEKIAKIPTETKDELKPLFNPQFWQMREV